MFSTPNRLGCGATTAFLALIAISISTSIVWAVESDDDAEEPLDPHRYEPALLPALGGNSDIGFLFGLFGVLAKFEPGYDPYRWRGQVIAVTSVKDGPEGAELPTHFYMASFDLPGLAGGRLRLQPGIAFSRIITGGYYGLGNLSSADVRPHEWRDDAVPGRHNQYIMTMTSAQLEARLLLNQSFDILAGLGFKYAMPELYAGSQLDVDAATREGSDGAIVGGVTDHASLKLAVGTSFDSRDHETVPTRGMYHILALRFSPGVVDTGLLFGGATMDARFFYPVFEDYLVLAGRIIGDLIFGDAPFYELGALGAFDPIGFSGARGIRGLPAGRFHGQAKLLCNLELRSMFVGFTLLKQRFRIGAAAFFDTGRIWATLSARPDLDGTDIGLKYGTGGGLRIQWGETLVIRIDIAYSPQATDADPDMPIGIYMDMAHMF